jgi:Fe-S cluster biogenesis protein NfuA
MAESYQDIMNRKKVEAREADECPLATQDVALNMENRQKAIDEAQYGPANPQLDETGGNLQFWEVYAQKFNDTVDNVMSMRCEGCTFFIQTPQVLKCIEAGLGEEGDPEQAIAGGDLGYCQAWDFKCASMRVCFSWAGKTVT